MGTRIANAVLAERSVKLTGATELAGHPKIGLDYGLVLGLEKLGVIIHGNVSEIIKDIDVAIEFAQASATTDNLKIVSESSKGAVIGTTGHTREQNEKIAEYSKRIPILISPNMSVGVNLLFQVAGEIASMLGDEYDVEIVETHHRLKKDAPSGTAKRFAEIIADKLGRDMEDVGVYGRKGITGEKNKKEIAVHSVRTGDVVGDHTIIFGGIGERIELTHKATSREAFASGAVRAAKFIHNASPGIYSMADALKG